MCRPRRANSFARMLPGVATPWPAAPPMPTAKSRLDIALWTAEEVDLRGRRKSTAPDRARSDSSGAARRQSTERSLRAASKSARTRCAALRALGASLDRSQPHPADERAPRVDGEPVHREPAAGRRIRRLDPRLGREEAGLALVLEPEVDGGFREARPGEKLELIRRRGSLRPFRRDHDGPEHELAMGIVGQKQEPGPRGDFE